MMMLFRERGFSKVHVLATNEVLMNDNFMETWNSVVLGRDRPTVYREKTKRSINFVWKKAIGNDLTVTCLQKALSSIFYFN